jgi:hypothetical protein
MATTRNSRNTHAVGATPPFVSWTMVRGDTASFKAYVTDDARVPLDLSLWDISMKVKRPNNPVIPVVITDDAQLIFTTTPAPEIDELPGYFTTFITSEQSHILQTGDIFDIQLTSPGLVWTVAQGSMIILEDVTD